MRKTLSVLILIVSLSIRLNAAGRTESALTLIEPSGARVAALGEAASALTDDITAAAYNPALLQSLSSGQMSLLFQRGLSQDGFGRLAIGAPHGNIAWGVSLGYYDSGSIQVFDGVSQRSVVGEKDLTAGLSLAYKLDGISAGVTGKYLSTDLAQTSSAKTMAIDLGLSTPLSANIGLGVAVQNLGGQLRYANASEELPRQARAGLSFATKLFSLPSHLLTEGIYRVDRERLDPALGLEVMTGPLAIRAGYRGGRDLDQFTVGTGFFWGSSSLDYAFGFADQLSSTHRISFSNRFGGTAATSPIAKKPTEPTAQQFTLQQSQHPVYEIKEAEGENPAARVYFVREGDTLKSIALAVYGREEMWEEIYRVNRHLLSDTDNFKVGQKILLPPKTQ